MDGAGIACPLIQPCYPQRDKIGIGGVLQVKAQIVPHSDAAQGRLLTGWKLEKRLEAGQIPVQVFIRVHAEIPRAGAAVHYRVAGGGEVVNPRKVEQDIGIPLRHLPGAVGGAGVGDHQLTGIGVPQGLEGLEAPFNTPDFILYNHADGEQGFWHGGHFLSTEGNSPFLAR